MRPIQKYKKSLLFSSLLLLLGAPIMAQKKHSLNLPKFEQRRFHFGFTVGVNSADMEIQRNGPSSPSDSLLVLASRPTAGLHMGIVSSLTLYKNLRLRFIPSLSLVDRNLEYNYKPDGQRVLVTTKLIESNYVELPLYLKYKSDRLNNFAAYFIAGGKYNIDLASNENVDNDKPPEDIVIKFKRNSFAFDVGVGTDFYLMYFKFGIEAKMSYNLGNIFIQDNTVYSSPIQKIRPRVFYLSLTFEG